MTFRNAVSSHRAQSSVRLLAVSILSAAVLLAGDASAGLINLDFVQNATTPTYTGAGVPGAAGQTWNRSNAGQGWLGNTMMAVNGLVDSTGAAIAGTSFTAAAAKGTVGDHNGMAPNAKLRPGGTGAAWAPLFDRLVSQSNLVLHFDGLGAGELYKVVLYQGYGATNSPSYTVNGVTKSVTFAAAAATMVQGRDYLVYENIAANANGRITIAYAGGWDSNSGLTAIQIEGGIPAPGALALLGLAGVVGARRRR